MQIYHFAIHICYLCLHTEVLSLDKCIAINGEDKEAIKDGLSSQVADLYVGHTKAYTNRNYVKN